MKSRTPKDITNYQKHYSDSGLFNKIGSTFRKVGLKVIYYVLLLYYVLKDENTPIHHKMIIIGALGYFILPVDMIPDFIPIAGFTDDAAALVSCLKTIKDNLTPEVRTNAADKLNEWFNSTETDKVKDYDDDINFTQP
jgi:uncharacterized membrane protein YkvA (DUF1232 family)